MEKKRYDAIDGLRTIACIGIVMMHIKANNSYRISGYVYDEIISSFTNFVFLFMVISSFGMCCGYLDRILNNQVSLEKFYLKRYSRILPFFAVLVLLDIAMSPSRASIIEGFADITLLFGLFPNDISVIGVGWFLGVVFAFYLIFPFFCVMVKKRKRAWMFFAVSLVLNYTGSVYFGLGRNNIIYCLCYLVGGALIYLYREELETFNEKFRPAVLIITFAAVFLYYIIGANTLTMLLVSSTLLILALKNHQGKILQNRFTKFISSVSMEIYLSHMVMYRVIEKIGLNTIIGDEYLQYIFTVIITVCGTVVFSVVLKTILKIAGRYMQPAIARIQL